MSDEQQQNTPMGAAMQGSYNASTLELRLDTQPIIDKIELYLSGTRTVYNQTKDGQVIVQKIKVSEPKMNDTGVNNIISFLTCCFSSAVVQGNWDDDWYRENLYSIHKGLAYIIMVNTDSWEVKPQERHMIIFTIMQTMKGFLSRLLNNEERISYIPTIRSVETFSNNEQKAANTGLTSGFGFFKK